MGGCYSADKHEGPEYSSIFGPRTAKGEVQKSQVENTPPPVISWEGLHNNKQVLTFLDLYNSEDSKHQSKRVTTYYGEEFIDLHEKSFGFDLLGIAVPSSDKGEIEFVFRLDPKTAISPGSPVLNLQSNGKNMADSHSEFPGINPDYEIRRPDIPAMKTAIGFPTKTVPNSHLGTTQGPKHQFAHIPANLIADAEEYQMRADSQLTTAPGPAKNPLENIAIDAYLENFTVTKFRENLQARYNEIVSYNNIASSNTRLAGIQFRDPLTVSSSLRFSDSSTSPAKFPTKLYPGLLSPPFLAAALAIIANKQSLSSMFTSYNDWAAKQHKFPFYINGEWTTYPTDNKIGISEDTKLPLLSLTGKGEYWTYFLESAYLRSLSDLHNLELKVQSLSYALKDIVGCPVQEVAFKSVGVTENKLQLLLSEIQTYGYPAAFVKSGTWSDLSSGEITRGVPWLLNEEIRIPTPGADGQLTETVYIGLSSPWKRKSSPTAFSKYQKNTEKILEHLRSEQTQPVFFSDVYLTPAEIFAAFDTYVVCHHTESFKFIPVKLDKPPSPYAFLEIDVTEPSRIYIMMSQPEHLLRHESITSAENFAGDRLFNAPTGKIALKGYNFIGFALFKKDKITKQVTLIENFGLSARDIWTKQDLTPGNYFLMVGSDDSRPL